MTPTKSVLNMAAYAIVLVLILMMGLAILRQGGPQRRAPMNRRRRRSLHVRPWMRLMRWNRTLTRGSMRRLRLEWNS